MIKVIGLGNILRGDDGIGPVVIQALEKSQLPFPVKLCDAGSDAFTILLHLLESEPVLIIDCTRMGKKPGTVHKIVIKGAESLPATVGASLHGFSLAEVWKIARSMGVDKELVIIGIEPENILYNSGLSDIVKNSIPIILEMVVEEVKKYAKKNSHH